MLFRDPNPHRTAPALELCGLDLTTAIAITGSHCNNSLFE